MFIVGIEVNTLLSVTKLFPYKMPNNTCPPIKRLPPYEA